MDLETIKVYNEKFEDYAKLVKTNKPSEALDRFMAQVKPGGGVLDLPRRKARACWALESLIR